MASRWKAIGLLRLSMKSSQHRSSIEGMNQVNVGNSLNNEANTRAAELARQALCELQ